MKCCKILFGIFVLFIFISFRPAFADTESELIEIKEYLTKDLPGFFASMKIKSDKYDAELLYKKAPGEEVTGLADIYTIDGKEVNESVAKAPNNTLDKAPLLKNNVSSLMRSLDYLADLKTQWDIEGVLYLAPIPPTETVSYKNKIAALMAKIATITGDIKLTPTAILDTHLQKYCNGKKAGDRCGNTNEDNFYKDVNIGKFLNEKISSDQEGFAVAIRNIVHPAPSDDYSKAIKLGESVENDDKLVFHLAETATLSTCYNSLNQMFKMRKPIPVGEKKTSMLQIMENEANKRFLSPEWKSTVDDASVAALLRELVQINAYIAWLSNQRYLQNERIELLLAARLSQSAQENRASAALFDMGGMEGFGDGGGGGDGKNWQDKMKQMEERARKEAEEAGIEY